MGCGAGLVTECAWPYGASENIVWEGVNDTVRLAAGSATVSLSPVRDCPTCDYANNNIDLIMLHPNSSDIDMRMTKETQVMPLDGLISQYGEVWFKVKNLDADKNMTLGKIATLHVSI